MSAITTLIALGMDSSLECCFFLNKDFSISLVDAVSSLNKFRYIYSKYLNLHWFFLSGLNIIISEIREIYQYFNLLYILYYKCNSSFLLLQNPSAKGFISLCWFYCYERRVEFSIDWYDHSHTMSSPTLVRAKHNFCSNKEDQINLHTKWNIEYVHTYIEYIIYLIFIAF